MDKILVEFLWMVDHTTQENPSSSEIAKVQLWPDFQCDQRSWGG